MHRMNRHMTRTPNRLFTAVAFTMMGSMCTAFAGELPANPDFRIVSPSTTGIPGFSSMSFVKFGPDGRLWVSARDFFWQQGGVAALDFKSGVWKTYSSAETPLEQFCNDIEFAPDGSAWIACDDSVVQLLADGETFISHNPASVVGPFADIAIAPNGHIWVANYGEVDLGGGLFEFDGATWVKHEESWMTTWTGVGFAPPLNVLARSNGDVWATFLSSPGCMGRYRNGQWTQITSGPYIIAMAETADGTLYGVSSFGAYRMNNTTEQWEQIGTIGAHSIAIDPVNEWLYIEHDLNIVSRYNGQNWSTFATFPGWTDAVSVGPDGHVWIAAETWPTHYDLHHYDNTGQMIRVYNRANTGMTDYFAPGMYLDRDGHMWFTDGEYGATRLEPNENWRNFGVYNGQEEVFPFWVAPVGLPWWQTPGADFWTESVDQVLHDSQGNFWLRGPNIVARSTGDDLSDWTVWEPGQNGFPWLCDSIGEDAQGNIWVGDSFGAYRLDGATWTEVPIGIAGQFAPVHGWTIAPDGELWVARVGTFYRWEANAFVPQLTLPVNIHEFEFAPNGHLWAATSDGLYRWDGTQWSHFTPQNSALAELAVVSLDIRPTDGLVAAATSEQFSPPYNGGVALFDVETSAWMSYDYGTSFLPFYAPGELQFDADGHLWISLLNYGAVQVYIGDEPTAQPGDVNGDGAVNVADLLLVIGTWGACSPPPALCPADLNADGQVNVVDLLMVIANWG